MPYPSRTKRLESTFSTSSATSRNCGTLSGSSSQNISQRSLRSQTYVKVGDAYIAISEARMAKSEDKGMARDCYQRALQIMQDDYNRGLLNADDEAQRKEVILKLVSVP